MKKISILLILIFMTILSFGQRKHLTDDDYNNSKAIQLIFVTSIEQSKEFAKIDIEKGILFLLLQSGSAPTVYASDSIFESHYHVFYLELGCSSPQHKIIKAYNQVVFEHLFTHYQKSWVHKIRKDVIGFEEWKKQKSY